MNICRRLFSFNSSMIDKKIDLSLKRSVLSIRTRAPELFTYNSISTSIPSIQIDDEKKAFRDVLPIIIDSLMREPKFVEEPELGAWLKKVMRHNLVGGKNMRGITTVISYKMMEKPECVTEESVRLAHTLGWCIEMFQAYSVILDDIMDGSTTRRGMPCWYLRPDVGNACAINDAVLIYSVLFLVLRNNFIGTPNYVKMFQIFNETMLFTSMGQHLDHVSAQKGKKDYSLFTIERYHDIVKNKASYYTFNLPVTLGLLLAQNVDQKIFEHVHDICLEIGKLFQIQDDFIDCFGDESLTGKAGTDIQEGKCSWLAVRALQRFTDGQRFVFKTCYGSQEPAHVERVKRLYEELHLPDLYRQEEREIYEDILERARVIPSDTAQMLFHKILDITYNRKQ